MRRFFRRVFKGIGSRLSIAFLLFSAAISLMILAPNCFDRVPVYSYFIRELKLPITYEINGKVKIVDVDGNIVNTDVEIIVGGYSTSVDSNGEYVLIFSAPVTAEIFVVIRYIDIDGNTIAKIESVLIKSGVHKIKREFVYNV
jgi:hypothetical protein